MRWKWYSARVGVEALFRLQEQVREGTVQVVPGVAVEEVAERGLSFRDHDRHALVRDIVTSVEPDFAELVRVFRDPSEVPVQAAVAWHARFRRNLDIFREHLFLPFRGEVRAAQEPLEELRELLGVRAQRVGGVASD